MACMGGCIQLVGARGDGHNDGLEHVRRDPGRMFE